MKGKERSTRRPSIVLFVAVILCLAFSAMGNVGAVARQAPEAPGKTWLQVDRESLREGDYASSRIGSATLSSATLPAVTDAELLQGYPTANCGSELQFRVGYDDYLNPDGMIVRGLVRFNLAAIPDHATISSAQLHLYLLGSWDYAGYSRTITTYRISAPWAEDTANWDNAPGLAEAYGSQLVYHDDAQAGKWYAFDVTGLVRGWHDGTYANYGIALRGPEHSGNDSSWKSFATSETIYAPELVVSFTAAAASEPAAPSLVSMQPPAAAHGVPAQGEDFGISVAPQALAVRTGEVARYTLTLTATALFNDPVTLEMTSTPEGMEAGFSPNPIVPPALVTMTVPTEGAALDEYALLISGTSGEILHTAPATLTIESHRTWLPLILGPSSPDVDSGTVFLFIGLTDYLFMEPYAAGARAGAPGYDLYFPTCDSADMFDTFSTRGCVGAVAAQRFGSLAPAGCPVANMRELNDARATKAAIRDAITSWLDARETRDTTVVIHFSGHGGYGQDLAPIDEADGREEFIAPYDLQCDPCGPTPETTRWLIETGIRDDELAEWLGQLESQRILLFIDSCFSGGMLQAAAQDAWTRSFMVDEGRDAGQVGDSFGADIRQPGRIVVTASSETQGSWEFAELKNGVFSYFLVEALRLAYADGNFDGRISAEEAFAYLAARVDNYVYVETGYHQNPQLYDGVAGEVNLTSPVSVMICP